MYKISMMTGAAAYVLGFGVYVIMYVSANWGNWDWVMYKLGEGIGFGLLWPFLLFQYFWNGTPMM
jgi:hypothetical protein